MKTKATEGEKIACELLKTLEGYQEKAYKCPAGVWTIGYGNTEYIGGSKVVAGDWTTKERAIELLLATVKKFHALTKKHLTHLTEQQKGAILSFIYNIGVKAFNESTLCKNITVGRLDDVATEMRKRVYVKKKKNQGLINRREAEINAFYKEET